MTESHGSQADFAHFEPGPAHTFDFHTLIQAFHISMGMYVVGPKVLNKEILLTIIYFNLPGKRLTCITGLQTALPVPQHVQLAP